MRKLVLLIYLFCGAFSLLKSQITNDIRCLETISDSIPKIENNINKKEIDYSIELNGLILDKNTILGFDSNNIETFVWRKDRIKITTKKNYFPVFISLQELKNKYANNNIRDYIFFINKQLINGNYNKSLIDESYILKIKIDKIYLSSNHKRIIGVINIFTKTEDNLKESQVLHLR